MSVIQDAILWLNDPLNWTNPDGIISRTVEHLWISAAAVALGCAVAWPLGVWMGHVGRGGPAVVTVTNLSRAVPTIALLTIFPLTVIGFGPPAIILALSLFAIPPLLANAYLGLREVDPEVRDAGRGMGLSGWQLLRKVELPLAVPYLANGFRVAAVQVLATATLAAYVNGGGLGMIISRGFGLGLAAGGGQVLAGGLLVALLCLTVEGLLALAEKALLPKSLRRVRHRPPASAADALPARS
ncbi:ABC transporter permease [Catellatospora coxensis]|uniref:Glycine/betaine ABC transporter permease n=1 Tax=Catellatospora coxensis TaxID=310354 RepID=A0A8J3PB00_9ACTN|nr:ABC transporter permease [Catellatospora coxensis]GIG10367.1 glycine/betaine ABC transporter permease [Catellatospora coxensis]